MHFPSYLCTWWNAEFAVAAAVAAWSICWEAALLFWIWLPKQMSQTTAPYADACALLAEEHNLMLHCLVKLLCLTCDQAVMLLGAWPTCYFWHPPDRKASLLLCVLMSVLCWLNAWSATAMLVKLLGLTPKRQRSQTALDGHGFAESDAKPAAAVPGQAFTCDT